MERLLSLAGPLHGMIIYDVDNLTNEIKYIPREVYDDISYKARIYVEENYWG